MTTAVRLSNANRLKSEAMRRIEKAVDLIRPSASDVARCQEAVETTFNLLELDKLNRERLTAPGSKEAKARTRRLNAALRRVELAAEELYKSFPALCFEIFANRDDALDKFEAEHNNALIGPAMLDKGVYDQFVSDVKHFFERSQKYADAATGRSSPMTYRAALYAWVLLRDYSPHPVVTTQGGTFCRLSALLYGDPKADLHHQCRKVLRTSDRERKTR